MATVAPCTSRATDVVRGRNVLLGLIGDAIGKSRAPAMHQGAAADAGLTCIYQLIDLGRLGLGAEALPDLLLAAERMGFAGVNVTFPCKQRVIEFLHELSPDAEALGAVNTVVFTNGQRVGHNTDWFGYATSLRQQLPDADLGHVTQFGAGGAGAAITYALLELGAARVSLVDTDKGRAEALAQRMAGRFGAGRVVPVDDAERAVAAASGIVNTTPVGMAKFPGTPFPAAWLKPTHWVSEIIYFPIETELLRRARALGCRTVDGSGMSVFQAAEAFRLFTGVSADLERLRTHFAEAGGAE
jgi:shikimate dehydrogenase